MKAKHTPGPWRYTTNVGPTRALIVEEDGTTVCEILNPHRSSGFETMVRQIVRDHNTAPELLTALTAIRTRLHECALSGKAPNFRDLNNFNRWADHAIAKARGEG